MKNTIKKLLLASILTIGALSSASCKKKIENNENTLEIYIADFGYGYEWLNSMIDSFKNQDWVKEKYPNLNIPAVKHNSVRSWAIDRIQAGESNTIDLFFGVTSGTSVFEQTYGKDKPYFEDLSDLYEMNVPNEEVKFKDKMDDNFLKMSTYKKLDGTSTYYCVPWVSGMQGLIYNKSMFERMGVSEPKTTNELYDVCAEIVKKGETPFIFTSKENYWTCMLFLIWWAQYEGLDNYCNFYQGLVEEDGITSMSKDVFKQEGRLESLKVIEDLLMYPDKKDYYHEEVNTMSFTQAQAKFLLGQGSMMPNGDWFETEITKSVNTSSVKDAFTFMKTPVISTITKSLEDTTMTDKTLSKVIEAIDNNQTSYEGVSANDFAHIKEARNLILPVGNHTAMIPAYSTAKGLAKDFLLFMATDTANEVFTTATNGASMPFKYDVKVKNPTLYNSLPTLQKARISMQENAVFMLNENTYQTVYYGGISRLSGDRTNIEVLMTSKNASDRKTAVQIFNEEIEYWDNTRWNSVLTNIGLK